jgi:hypothetical protein
LIESTISQTHFSSSARSTTITTSSHKTFDHIVILCCTVIVELSSPYPIMSSSAAGPSSGAAEKSKFHDGRLKPYSHEELGREVGLVVAVFVDAFETFERKRGF